jgi:hypothetical protein
MPAIDLKVPVDQPATEARAQILDNIGPRMSAVHLTGHAQGDTLTYETTRTLPAASWSRMAAAICEQPAL